MCACEHVVTYEEDGENNTDIYIPPYGYIFFDTELSTRGVPIENALTDSFYVLGYKYMGDWTTIKPQVSQNAYGLFDYKPQLVEYKDGMHTYKDTKAWAVDSTYSFYAWYPAVAANDGIVSWCGADYIGNPYIVYKFKDIADPKTHVDVMTASVVNHKMDPSIVASKSVSLNMAHRLSSLDILARSYVNAAALGYTGGEARVKIESLILKMDSLLYNTDTIPLHPEDEMRPGNVGGSDSVTYKDFISPSSAKVIVYNNNSDNIAQITKNDTTTMFLIPQESEIKCTVTVEYDIVDENGKTVWKDVYKDPANSPDSIQEQTVTIKRLQERYPYYLLLNFTKAGLNLILLEAESWEDDDVYHEFE